MTVDMNHSFLSGCQPALHWSSSLWTFRTSKTSCARASKFSADPDLTGIGETKLKLVVEMEQVAWIALQHEKERWSECDLTEMQETNCLSRHCKNPFGVSNCLITIVLL